MSVFPRFSHVVIGYLMEATVDCKHGILAGVDVYSANEKESVLILRHLERQINLGIPMSRLALDRGYETGAVHRGLELLGITGYIPAIQFSNPPEKAGVPVIVKRAKYFALPVDRYLVKLFMGHLHRQRWWFPYPIKCKSPVQYSVPHRRLAFEKKIETRELENYCNSARITICTARMPSMM